MGKKRERITRNIVRGKLNVKCVSVRLGNAIGQDIWELESICWGVGVEKLMMMWGEGEDETKGGARLITTVTNHCRALMALHSIVYTTSKTKSPIKMGSSSIQ